MTLTTEQLRSLRDALKSWQDGYDPTDDKEQYEMFVTEETAVGELLANREAQPVGFRYRHRDTVSWLYNDWRWPDSVEAEQCQIEWLYTAPPAPAVVKLPTEFYSNEGIVVRLEQVMAALALIGVKYERKGDACRAAMLENIDKPAPQLDSVVTRHAEQPVSGGYKLAPIDPTEDMIAAAMNCDDVSFNADETFCVNFGNIYAAMLAAAPEGGNDHDTRR